MWCVSSGTVNQGDVRFGESAGRQCMAMATAAVVFKSRFGEVGRLLSSEQIDLIVNVGDSLYRQSNLAPGEIYLEPWELKRSVEVEGIDYGFSIVACVQGYFDEVLEQRVRILCCELEMLFAGEVVCEGYIFTAHKRTVSFWESSNGYFVFNSHSVDETGRACYNGLARVFRCESISKLAEFLLIGHSYSGEGGNKEVIDNAYDITGVRSVAQGGEGGGVDSAAPGLGGGCIEGDCVGEALDVLENIEEERLGVCVEQTSEGNVVRRRGRPKKSRGGRPGARRVFENAGGKCSGCVDVGESNGRGALSVCVKQTSEGNVVRRRGRPGKSRRGRPAGRSVFKDVAEKCGSVGCDLGKRKVEDGGRLEGSTGVKRLRKVEAVGGQAEAGVKELLTGQKGSLGVGKRIGRCVKASALCISKRNIGIRKAQARYASRKPEAIGLARARYVDRKRCAGTLSRGRERKNLHLRVKRAVPDELRQFRCIATCSLEELVDLQPLRLKVTSLESREAVACEHCDAKMFFEEATNSREWCCGSGRYHSSKFKPLTASFY